MHEFDKESPETPGCIYRFFCLALMRLPTWAIVFVNPLYCNHKLPKPDPKGVPPARTQRRDITPE